MTTSVQFGTYTPQEEELLQEEKTKAIDIIMFVAGTTDPFNVTGKKHEANSSYWRDSNENFWSKIKELKLQYLDLHIEDNFFSWSGDNNTSERNLAAERLLDLFVRVYPGFKNKSTHLHLIGHSHGGNVINQFTELISTDKRFPKLWEVKSITYLSTPFFEKKHQLNHTKLNKSCKIINVYNEYDITQRFIADFSLINLEILIQKLDTGKFKVAIDKIGKVDFNVYNPMTSIWGKYSNKEGYKAWEQTAILLEGIGMLFDATIEYINSIETRKFKKEKEVLINLLTRIHSWSKNSKKRFKENQTSRKKYNRSVFFDDLIFLNCLQLINELLDIETDVNGSYLLKLLSTFFMENTGITESLEETSWTPIKQAKDKKIIDINITGYDLYHSRNKKQKFDTFLSGIQAAQRQRNLKEILMRLFSQFISADRIEYISGKINTLEYVVKGDIDKQLKRLRKNNLKIYQKLVEQFNADLITRSDMEQELHKRPGSLPYLAMVSHSLSHTKYWLKVDEELRSAFSSGKNPGYKSK